jgi:hypothetical protein
MRINSGSCAPPRTTCHRSLRFFSRLPNRARKVRQSLGYAAPPRECIQRTIDVPVFHDQSRETLRRMYAEAWRKHREGAVMEPLEMQVADVIALHPEYHVALEQQALARDYLPDDGQSNPFLHMGLHLAVRDQVATDRPHGVREIFESLTRRLGSAHDAEHRMIERLAESLWNAQRSGRLPDEQAYLESLRELPSR